MILRPRAPLPPGTAPGLLLSAGAVARDDNPEARAEERERDVTKAILEYLAEHPRAMDSLDGIAEWWLARARIRRDVSTVARVLTELTRQGVLEEVAAAGGVRYRLKRE